MEKSMSRISMFVLFFVFSNLFIPLLASQIKILPGTEVQLELGQTISAKTVSIGDMVSFKVINDLIVDDNVVINANTMAFGEVIDVSKPGALGKPGSLGISIKYTNAIDGTKIPLSASRIVRGEDKQTEAILVTLILCVFGIFIKGGDATLQAGSIIETTVSSVVNVEIEEQEISDDGGSSQIENNLKEEVIQDNPEEAPEKIAEEENFLTE